MSFFKRLSDMFKPSGSPASDASYWFTVQCKRCGERIRGRVDTRNDPSIEYGERDSDNRYYVRKVLMGDQGCYNKIEVELTYDAGKHLVDRKITGGTFVDES